MENKRSKIPASAAMLYVKYYTKLLKKKGIVEKQGNKKKEDPLLIDGLKSWKALSKSEQKMFYDKYQEICKIRNKKIASCLKESEPFLKRKKIVIAPEQILHQNTITQAEADAAGESEIPNTFQRENLDKSYLNNDESVTRSDSMVEFINVENQNVTKIEEVSDIRNECAERLTSTIPQDDCIVSKTAIKLTEPTPPSILSGKQLFENIQLKDKENISSWGSISRLEKGRYQRAVLLQKKEYLQRYKAFLENLSSEELFNFCHKSMNK